MAYLALPGALGQRGVDDLVVLGVGELAVAVI